MSDRRLVPICCAWRRPTWVPRAAGLRRRRSSGFSLLEVILAIAILGMSIAMIGQLVNLGTRQAAEARDLTAGQLLCESKMAEIAAGVTPLEAAAMVPFENDPRWMYTIALNPLDEQGLVEVRVAVQQVESTRLQPLSFTLVCWMIDPSLASTEVVPESTESESTESTSTEPVSTGSQSATGDMAASGALSGGDSGAGESSSSGPSSPSER